VREREYDGVGIPLSKGGINIETDKGCRGGGARGRGKGEWGEESIMCGYLSSVVGVDVLTCERVTSHSWSVQETYME
jgi:hypothetical protein